MECLEKHRVSHVVSSAGCSPMFAARIELCQWSSPRDLYFSTSCANTSAVIVPPRCRLATPLSELAEMFRFQEASSQLFEPNRMRVPPYLTRLIVFCRR